MSPSSRSARHQPRQRRSREIVQAILEAGRELLERDGAEALSTHRIAERAGVSIGSVYRYFEDKQAVVAALYDDELRAELDELASGEPRPLAGLQLREGVARLVDFQLERHRRLLSLEGDWYRDHHRELSLAQGLGPDQVLAWIEGFLAEHARELCVADLGQAAFLLGRGVSGIVRLALEHEPERLAQPAFRNELIDMLVRYLTASGAGPAGAGQP